MAFMASDARRGCQRLILYDAEGEIAIYRDRLIKCLGLEKGIWTVECWLISCLGPCSEILSLLLKTGPGRAAVRQLKEARLFTAWPQDEEVFILPVAIPSSASFSGGNAFGIPAHEVVVHSLGIAMFARSW